MQNLFSFQEKKSNDMYFCSYSDFLLPSDHVVEKMSASHANENEIYILYFILLKITDLCRGTGGPPHPGVRTSRDGEAARHDGRTVSPPGLHHHSEGAGHVPDLPGQPHHPGRQGCCRTPPGLCEVGGTAEEREEGTVDGVPAGAGLGLQGQLPHYAVICSRRSICVYVGDLTI